MLAKRPRVRRRPRTKPPAVYLCCCCNQTVPFCWTCRCGLSICQACMAENIWGVTCNRITWQCPDCGRWHGFGNG